MPQQLIDLVKDTVVTAIKGAGEIVNAVTDTVSGALVNALNGGNSTRSAVLLQIAENEGFVRAKSNEMFVMMEYFGYLRRDPDEDGYRFWLSKLNQFGGDFNQAEMVKAFISSREYRQRFAQ